MVRSGDIAKRVFDLLGAGALIVASAPLMGAAALAVRATLGSPVLFRQVRVGWRDEPFMILKFRTMRDPAPGEVGPLSDGERLTRLGRFLRSTSIDELPELLNVIRGEMSLVGPRPLLTRYLERYTARQRRRHEVRPGITGWAQVNGRNALSWEEKFELDVWYVENRSLRLDVEILLRTLVTVVRRDGVSHGEAPTMPEYMG